MEKWEKGKKYSVIHDPRGDIIPVAEGLWKFVMLLESKKGTTRANHWHKTDAHVMHVISGHAQYYEEDKDGNLEMQVMLPGDSIFTGPGVPHAIEFLEDTLMVVCTKNPRDYDSYMGDLVKKQIL